MTERGAEVILDSAKFWASRLEWDPEAEEYHLSDVIGPDEYHEHVDDNAYTNYLARWHMHTAVAIAKWLKAYDTLSANHLFAKLAMDEQTFADWVTMADQIFCPQESSSGLIEQFAGYFERTDALASDFDPRSESVQSILGMKAPTLSRS